MLKWLNLTHLVLIDKSHIPFEPGFNILTGETGAGKTALTEALNLLLGAKGQQEMIRAGEKEAIIEAAFDITNALAARAFLDHHAIAYDLSEPLIVKRILSKTGKNRSFIGTTQVPMNLVRELTIRLIEIASQHATIHLRQKESQLALLDLAAEAKEALESYQSTYRKLQESEETLAQLCADKADLSEKIELYRYQAEEIDTLALQEGEEEALFDEYRQIGAKQDEFTDLKDVLETIDHLPSFQGAVDTLTKYGHTEIAHALKGAANELIEVSFTLSNALSSIEEDPNRLEEIDKRLTEIGCLKKKYGDISLKKAFLDERLSTYETLDDSILDAKQAVDALKKLLLEKGAVLTDLRQKGAQRLAKQVTDELQSLNMASALFEIAIQPINPHLSGCDEVTFMLTPNKGEGAVSLQKRASGGELARIFFALKFVLADQENLPILIFDEIDANIGGETATIIGQKLRELGTHRQVIAITHFPQVASSANNHLKVVKAERNQRTITQVIPLDKTAKKDELLRMLGGHSFKQLT